MQTREEKEREIMKHQRDKHHYATKKRHNYDDDVTQRERANIASDLFSIVAVLGTLLGSLFLSPNITGNVAGSGNDSANLIGAVLLVVGIIATFFYFRVKKK